MSICRLPLTAEKVYQKRVDADTSAYYILPKNGKNVIRIFINSRTGNAYNSAGDIIPLDDFTSRFRRGLNVVSLQRWENIKQGIRRR